MTRIPIIPTAALLAACLVLAQQATVQDRAQFERGIGDASKKIKLDNPNLVDITKDITAVRNAYNILDHVQPVTTTATPDELLNAWKDLRTGDGSIPAGLNLGPSEILRHGLAMQNAKGGLSDSGYITISGELLQREKELPSEMVEGDRAVVLRDLPQLRGRYRDAGFNDVEANEAAVATWYQVRLGPKATHDSITDADLLGRRMGRLVIVSDPLEAAVIVNGHPWPDPTRASGFIEAGEVSIVLSKTGYETLSDSKKVEADKSNEFKWVLKKKP